MFRIETNSGILTPHKLDRLVKAARKSGKRKKALRELNKAARIQAITIELQASRIIQLRERISKMPTQSEGGKEMLQIAREKVRGLNNYIIGFELKKKPQILSWQHKGDWEWQCTRSQQWVMICNTVAHKILASIGAEKLKPGEGPIDIKIVRA